MTSQRTLTHGQPFNTVSPTNAFGFRRNYNFGGYRWHGYRHMHYGWLDMAGGEGTPATWDAPGWLNALGGGFPQGIQGGPCGAPGSGNALSDAGMSFQSGGPSRSKVYLDVSLAPIGYGDNGIFIPRWLPPFMAFEGEYQSWKYNHRGAPFPLLGHEKSNRHPLNLGTGPEWVLVVQPAGNVAGGAPQLVFCVDGTDVFSLNPGQAETNTYGPLCPSIVDTWNRYEVFSTTTDVTVRMNSQPVAFEYPGSGSATTMRVWPDNTVFTDPSGNVYPGASYDPWAASYGSQLQLETQDPNAPAPSHLLTDIYHDFTCARMELSGPNASGVIVNEPQILTHWDKGHIAAVCNGGEIAPGSTCVATVYSRANAILAQESVIFGG